MKKLVDVTMNEDIRLQNTYGTDAICGYIRNPKRYNQIIVGTCALDSKYCSKRLPMDELNCRRQIQYFFFN
jgi:hypothetical protein